MKASKRVWVTGAGGLIGNYVVQTAPTGCSPIGLTRQDLDLLDLSVVENRFRRENPDAIIHCAAISSNPFCQEHPQLAQRTNVETTQILSSFAESIPFIFISSDLVFDGKKGAYVESDSPNPLSKYGETKAEAEMHVMKNSRHTIIRTSLNGGKSPTRNRGFNEHLQQTIRAGKTMTLFTDEYRSPISAKETARTLWEILNQNLTGILHLAGAERLSRFKIGRLLADHWKEGRDQILAGSLNDYKGPPRAADTSLCCEKLQTNLRFPLPRFSQWLQENPTAPF
ncbi:MAG TPA: NAD(P)-dependent oxidoreductase [Verrucomicrobiales bacterium]|nr:NAD(P)-dependent oxidoreductase [Pedosphaera sp.]MBL6843173.1 SDR family oxidoreductase [Verrucomicrobiae bacterium]HAO67562.1 NAD(P)-dependent oxidoreductase [Verrucomicrobiales bacterium]HBP57075.1 NAD(P)-dependent oxidoreductase [Verrucomicrobiales bacterium]HCZ04372.1 NAD(P)-dependent oxidoreductase [Verrucomicrobiales bacterium]